MFRLVVSITSAMRRPVILVFVLLGSAMAACPSATPFKQIRPKACSNEANKCSGDGVCDLKEKVCCFKEKKDGPDDKCTADLPFSGISCPGGKDDECAAGGPNGKCTTNTCCYAAAPTLPELNCPAATPYGVKSVCTVDADCKEGEGPKCSKDEGVCCYTKKQDDKCPAKSTPGDVNNKCTPENAKEKCNEQGVPGECHDGLCCYATDAKTPSTNQEGGNWGPKPTPSCPADKPEIRELCVNGKCSQLGDVCHNNNVCCYNQNEDNVPVVPYVRPPPPQPRPRPVVPTRPKNEACRDKGYDCIAKAYLCLNASYRRVMMEQCPRTCGFCAAVGNGGAGNNSGGFRPGGIQRSCRDLGSDCPHRAYLCNNSLYYQLMSVQCPRTCRRC